MTSGPDDGFDPGPNKGGASPDDDDRPQSPSGEGEPVGAADGAVQRAWEPPSDDDDRPQSPSGEGEPVGAADGATGGSWEPPSDAGGGGLTTRPEGGGQPRPGGMLLLATWVLVLSGIGLFLIASLLGAQGSGDAALFGFASLLALTVGLLSGAGYQALSRSRRPAEAYRGPAPVLLFVVVVVLTTLVIAVLLAIGLPNPVDVTGAAVLSVVVTEAMYAVVVWAVVVRPKVLGWSQMGWPSWPERGRRTLVRDVLVGAGLVVPTYLVTEIGAGLLSAALGVQLSTPLPTPQTSGGWVAFALAVALITPFGEELFFRGYALTAWRRDLGERSALVRATLFFAIVHVLNVIPTSAVEGLKVAVLQFVVIVPVGWVLGWLFLRRGIASSIAGHAAWNSIAVLLLLASVHAGG